MAERIVRVTRIIDVPVVAEYGDTDESLVEKAAPAADDAGWVEARNLLPEAA